MKSPLVLSACIASIIGLQCFALAAEPADAQWAELETLMKGPKSRPKTQEEAKEMVKAYIAELEAKTAEFRKAYPTDPRRWKISIQEIQSNPMRGMAGLPKKSDEEIAKLSAEIIAAPDADKVTKGAASFY